MSLHSTDDAVDILSLLVGMKICHAQVLKGFGQRSAKVAVLNVQLIGIKHHGHARFEYTQVVAVSIDNDILVISLIYKRTVLVIGAPFRCIVVNGLLEVERVIR